jgi:hypothetical protein
VQHINHENQAYIDKRHESDTPPVNFPSLFAHVLGGGSVFWLKMQKKIKNFYVN